MGDSKQGATPTAEELGKISFSSSPIRIRGLTPFGSTTQDPLSPEIQISISKFTGMNLEIFQAWTFVLPIFSVFESIYMRAATKHGHTKAPEKNQGHPTIENVTFDEFKKEHHEFEKRLKSEHNLDGDQLNTILDNYGLNYRAAQRFYNYFEGKKLSDGLEPEDDEDQDEEFYPPSDLGSCANILGCTFNLTPVSEFVNGNRELLIHKEHSRPNSNFGSDADQKMCAPHNFAKGENKIFDVFGLFYCATGKNLR